MGGRANLRLIAALAFAVRAHGDVKQERKGTDFPYVAHPIRVAEILDRFGCGEDVIVAGFLHDTVEDANISAEELTAAFGPRVAALVIAVSEPDKSLPWKIRKEHSLAALEQEQDADVLALVAGDKLDNVRSLADTLRHLGSETWTLFNAERREQHWLVLQRDCGDPARARRGEPAVPHARLRDAECVPRPAKGDEVLRRKAVGTPHDARAYLADPIKHWRPDHSALELATIWIGTGDLPSSVRKVLETCDAYAACSLVEGFFEREVELGTRGRPSQTDLLALVQLPDGYGVIAVEGKAREPFGELVSAWNDSVGKQARLDDLCEELGLDSSQVGNLRYQLLHRTVSALIEARRYGARQALMLVHSFDAADSSLDAYQDFAEALGLQNAVPNAITSHVVRGDVTLRLGWIREARSN